MMEAMGEGDAPTSGVHKLGELGASDRVPADGTPEGPVGERDRVPDEERSQSKVLLEKSEERGRSRERGWVRGREEEECRDL